MQTNNNNNNLSNSNNNLNANNLGEVTYNNFGNNEDDISKNSKYEAPLKNNSNFFNPDLAANNNTIEMKYYF